MEKKLIDRFEKDLFGVLNTMLILGIIIEGKNVWTYQIKKRLGELNDFRNSIPESTLYTTLNKLEKEYRLIQSTIDEEVQRRYFSTTNKGIEEFNDLILFWQKINMLGSTAVEKLNIST